MYVSANSLFACVRLSIYTSVSINVQCFSLGGSLQSTVFSGKGLNFQLSN